MIIESKIFQRAELLLGEECLKRISNVRIIVFGVGGVGSWVAEGLVRSGVYNLTIVDCDNVCVSNINRQLMATVTVGKVKVEALKQHLLQINPNANITAINKAYSAETSIVFNLESYDYIVDAIDSLENKCNLILSSCKMPGKLYSSMGAALKLDPTSYSSF